MLATFNLTLRTLTSQDDKVSINPELVAYVTKYGFSTDKSKIVMSNSDYHTVEGSLEDITMQLNNAKLGYHSSIPEVLIKKRAKR